jgi:integrase
LHLAIAKLGMRAQLGGHSLEGNPIRRHARAARPRLSTALIWSALGVKTFLVTHFGKPYTAPGFGNWFRELCDAADCSDVSAHGLRKATARRLAEIGCSANQIASITGHASLSEVQRYTKAADRKRMAREAMAKLIEGGW